MAKNLKTSLRRRRRGNPMAEYDCLSPALRAWLSQAALQWSVTSVRRAWKRALRAQGGCEQRAISQMDGIERKLLERDAGRIWGEGYPRLGGNAPL